MNLEPPRIITTTSGIIKGANRYTAPTVQVPMNLPLNETLAEANGCFYCESEGYFEQDVHYDPAFTKPFPESFELVEFDVTPVTVELVQAQFERAGLRSATLYELVAFMSVYADQLKGKSVLALGTWNKLFLLLRQDALPWYIKLWHWLTFKKPPLHAYPFAEYLNRKEGNFFIGATSSIGNWGPRCIFLGVYVPQENQNLVPLQISRETYDALPEFPVINGNDFFRSAPFGTRVRNSKGVVCEFVKPDDRFSNQTAQVFSTPQFCFRYYYPKFVEENSQSHV